MNEKMMKVINFLKSKNFESYGVNMYINNYYTYHFKDILIIVEVGNNKTHIKLAQNEKYIVHEYISTYYIKQIQSKINDLLDGAHNYNIIPEGVS